MTHPDTTEARRLAEQFFAEAKKLGYLRMPMSHADMCAAFDAKDAIIADLRAQVESLTAERDAARAELDTVMDMALCEPSKLVLRIGQLYRFTPVDGCASCDIAMDAAIEAYGPPHVSEDGGGNG